MLMLYHLGADYSLTVDQCSMDQGENQVKSCVVYRKLNPHPNWMGVIILLKVCVKVRVDYASIESHFDATQDTKTYFLGFLILFSFALIASSSSLVKLTFAIPIMEDRRNTVKL